MKTRDNPLYFTHFHPQNSEIRRMSRLCLRSLSIWLGIVWLPWECAVGQVWPEGDEFIHRIYRERSRQSATDFQQLADSILELPSPSTCQREAASQVFQMNAWVLLPDELPENWEDQISLPDSCQAISARYHILAGAMHYKSKDWPEAVQAFETAISLARDSVFLTEAYNNLSATLEKIAGREDQVIEAIEMALRYANQSQSPFLLNNIVALNIQRGNWARANQFSQRFLIDLSTLPNNLQFNIYLNRLILALRLEQTEDASELFNQLVGLDVTPGNECTFARIASKHLLIADAYERYRDMYGQLAKWIQLCPEASESVQTEGLLFQPWREAFQSTDTAQTPVSREAWQRLRRTQLHLLFDELDHSDSYGGLISARPEEASSESSPWRWLAEGAGLLLILVLMGLLFKQRRNSEHLTRKRLRSGLGRLKELVGSTQSDPALLREIERLESEWLGKSVRPLLDRFKDVEFTPIEVEILRMLANGRTSKEIAILLDVSLSYVYNIRTGLRKKFQLSESEDLDAWIVDQARILGRSNPN